MYTASSAAPIEDSLNAYENHQDSLPDETSNEAERILAGIADYFINRIFLGSHRLGRLEAGYYERFLEVAMEEVKEINEDTLSEFLALSKKDQCEAGKLSSDFADKCAKQIAKEFREELEPLAIEYAYIK
ncbi:hypothetical protein ACJJIE_03740 [Microbulbifer sp. TRSA001]|uniref:hypothetical protein n=1 Tax=Microbulbifer sp. TRSA001 TaxID=3243381 RepID=UPI004039E1EF